MEGTSSEAGLGPQPLPPCPGPDCPESRPLRRPPTGLGGVARGLPAGPPSALHRAGLTCDVLAPGVVQVRGQHVPHGEEEPRPDPPASRRCPRRSGRRRWRHAARPGPLPLSLAAASALPALQPRRVGPDRRLRPAPSPPRSKPAAPRPAPPGPAPRAEPRPRRRRRQEGCGRGTGGGRDCGPDPDKDQSERGRARRDALRRAPDPDRAEERDGADGGIQRTGSALGGSSLGSPPPLAAREENHAEQVVGNG